MNPHAEHLDDAFVGRASFDDPALDHLVDEAVLPVDASRVHPLQASDERLEGGREAEGILRHDGDELPRLPIKSSGLESLCISCGLLGEFDQVHFYQPRSLAETQSARLSSCAEMSFSAMPGTPMI